MTDEGKPRKPDPNTTAKRMIDQLTARTEGREVPECEDTTEQEKDPAAVELGRKGGKKGGPARAKKLTAKERSEIAKKAAESRWADRGD